MQSESNHIHLLTSKTAKGVAWLQLQIMLVLLSFVVPVSVSHPSVFQRDSGNRNKASHLVTECLIVLLVWNPINALNQITVCLLLKPAVILKLNLGQTCFSFFLNHTLQKFAFPHLDVAERKGCFLFTIKCNAHWVRTHLVKVLNAWKQKQASGPFLLHLINKKSISTCIRYWGKIRALGFRLCTWLYMEKQMSLNSYKQF